MHPDNQQSSNAGQPAGSSPRKGLYTAVVAVLAVIALLVGGYFVLTKGAEKAGESFAKGALGGEATDSAAQSPGRSNFSNSTEAVPEAVVGDPEGLVDPSTYPELVRTLHQDMASAFTTMKTFLNPQDSAKLDLNFPGDYAKFTGSDAAKYLSIASYTASVESKDGKNIDVEMAKDTLATVISKKNPAFAEVSSAIDGTHGITTVLSAVGEDFPRLEYGTTFMGHPMPRDGGQVVKIENNVSPGQTLALFETIEVGGEKTLLYVDNFSLYDNATKQALKAEFGHL